jgi:RimJ/RimL family protein N-acetyltransferase
MTAMALSDLQLLDLQIDALFTHDAAGRISFANELGGDRAPRFFFGRTREGNRWRVRDDLPAALVQQLNGLAADEPVHDDLRAEPRHLAAFRAALGTMHEVQSPYTGPAYRFPEVLSALTTTTQLAYADLHLLGPMGWNINAEAAGFAARVPYLAIVADGAVVSVCFCARITGRAAEAGLETAAEYRGRGYGPAIVVAWAQAIRASGRIPLYSTSWDNLASQAVARKLGLVQYATDLSLG